MQTPRDVTGPKPMLAQAPTLKTPHERRTVMDFHPEVLNLFDQYVHGLIDRRRFLEHVAKFTAAGVTAVALLDALNPKFAEAQQVHPSDPRLRTEMLEFETKEGYGKMRGYLARPKAAVGKLPTILVVHENRGLNPHIEDITRRLALEDFMAFAPDALFPLGGYPGDEDKARELFAKLDQSKTQADFLAAARNLKRRVDSNGKLGTVGFCWGGGIAHVLATRLRDLDAAVAFYGLAPAPELARQVKAPLLVHLAEHDERINQTWPPYEAALRAAHAKFEVYHYPGTQHGFNNDTTPRYDASAAKLAWQRTLEFFRHRLRQPSQAHSHERSG